tara:strand:- start:84 stop:209 length:126 start_codon:yes stop_codon:yes gene_type:complete
MIASKRQAIHQNFVSVFSINIATTILLIILKNTGKIKGLNL